MPATRCPAGSVEESLRVRLAAGKHVTTLIDEALSAGHIDEATHLRLHAARKLRKEFSHPELQTVWSFGMAGGVVKSSHELPGRGGPQAL